MACRGTCKITFGEVSDFARNVQIQSARRYQLDVRTWTEAAGTSQNIPLPALDPSIVNDLKAYLRRFLYENNECAAGCYCDSFGEIITREVAFAGVSTNLHRETVRAQASISVGDSTHNEVLDDVRSGRRMPTDTYGLPVPVSPALDEIRSGLNCCGQRTIDLVLVNHFVYEISYDATVTLLTEQGQCKTLPGLEGSVIV